MSLNGQHFVKIGDSIRKKQKSNLMTFRYDFLPGSVATNKPGEVKLDVDNCVSVKLPNVPGSNPEYTLYKGTYKEAIKECVLIVDRITGQMTLEKIDYNVNLKNSRIPVISEPNNVNKLKSVDKNKLSENLDDMTDTQTVDRQDNIKKADGMKINQRSSFNDPFFGDLNNSDHHNLSDSDDDDEIQTQKANQNPVNDENVNDFMSESEPESEGDKNYDVTAQVAEDLQITDSSNSENSSSDSEMNN